MSVNVRHEPALAVAVFQAVIAMAVSFGLNLSAEQVGTVVALAAAVSARFGRQHGEPVSPEGSRAATTTAHTGPDAPYGPADSPPATATVDA
jgi:hypothetical protein